MYSNQYFFSNKTINQYSQNQYWYFANSLFGYICALYSSIDIYNYLLNIFRRYQVGITHDDKVIYWQCDANGHCRAAKMIEYDTNGMSLNSHWHYAHPSYNTSPPDRLPFGLHLLAKHPLDASIVVVESEKSALLGATYNLHYLRNDTRLPLFIATGSADIVTTLKHLQGRNVTLFPCDNNTEEWLRIARDHSSLVNSIEVNAMVRYFTEQKVIKPGGEYSDLITAMRQHELRKFI